jgi:hypothetical protein
MNKIGEINIIEKKHLFIRSRSIFDSWVDDTNYNYEEAVNIDLSKINFLTFLEHSKHVNDVRKALNHHYPFILYVYKILISSGTHYPFITLDSLKKWMQETEIIDLNFN